MASWLQKRCSDFRVNILFNVHCFHSPVYAAGSLSYWHITIDAIPKRVISIIKQNITVQLFIRGTLNTIIVAARLFRCVLTFHKKYVIVYIKLAPFFCIMNVWMTQNNISASRRLRRTPAHKGKCTLAFQSTYWTCTKRHRIKIYRE